MCGIVSLFSKKKALKPQLLEEAIKQLHKRGPDGYGIWISHNHLIGLAHCRLSMVGDELGNQPIWNEDKTISIVVNGEFYNFESIRKDLENRGHQFFTRSDSEIALHLYEEYGLDFVKYLRGEFAFVIWDGRKNQMLAVRDRFGIKPLCYYQDDEQLIIASQAKGIFALGIKPEWDDYAFYHSASMQYLPYNRTLFSGIRQIPPGCILIATENFITIDRYWDICFESEEQYDDEENIKTKIYQMLEESIHLRLQTKSKLCVHLSGGLDSSAIAAITSRQMKSPLDCFTVCFDKNPYNEGILAQELATELGANWHPVMVSDQDQQDYLFDAVYASEGLAINGHLVAKYLLNREIHRQGFKGVLSGEGADEAFAGYAHLQSDLNQGANSQTLANTMTSGMHFPYGEGLSLSSIQETLGYIPCFLSAKSTMGFQIHSLLSDEFKFSFSQTDCFKDMLSQTNQQKLKGTNQVHTSLYLWSKLALANYILKTLGDGVEMCHSIEGRLPFLDHKLFELAAKLPIDMKIRDGVSKYILRKALGSYLPSSVIERKKQPFLAPPTDLTTWLKDLSFSHIPFLDDVKCKQFFQNYTKLSPEAQVARNPILYFIATTFAIHEKFDL